MLSVDASKANAIKSSKALTPSQALRREIRARGAKLGSISYLYSGKNDIDFVFPSEIMLACGLLLEADEGVSAYEIDPDRISERLHQVGYVGPKPQFIVWHWESPPMLLDVKRSPGKSVEENRLQLARAIGCGYEQWDETFVHERERLFHDWQQISPVLAQTRHQVKAQYEYLTELLLEACAEPITLDELRKARLGPWELIFASVFFLAQKALITTDLHVRPLSPETRVRRRGTFHAYQKILT